MVSTIVLVTSGKITRILGPRGVMAIERLSGLVLTTIAVEMFLNGLREFLK